MTDLDTDIDFKQINPQLGSKIEAFEEICCQLAHRTANGDFRRLHGAGGDGGIECYADTPDGRCGWQAKYVFTLDALIRQATESLATALAVHPTLTRFVLCFPFNPTGPTARRGRSGTEKLDDWKKKQEEAAHDNGRKLHIEMWPLATLRSLLLDHDPSGGLRYFFFSKLSLSENWFDNHLQNAVHTAGPRYTPELNVETAMRQWVAAFGRETSWTASMTTKLSPIRDAEKSLGYVLGQPKPESDRNDGWPDTTLEETRFLVERMQPVLNTLEDPTSLGTLEYEDAITSLSKSVCELGSVEAALMTDLENRHGADLVNSPDWRQFMAEYMNFFPTKRRDAVQGLVAAVEALVAWLRSPECSLAFQDVFVLSGDPGTGKTHGICDAAMHRHKGKLRTCIVFGHAFGNQPDPWSRVAESLGLSVSLGADRLLDCLNAAGEASGFPLLLCIDAINETKPLSYWKNHIASMVQRVRTRPNVRLCLVCKTAYLSRCLPDGHDYPVITHRGFSGIERQACQSYFRHYGLRPPISPILQPELSNPLYLRLVCETLAATGQNRLPAGWSGGGTSIIRDFLRHKASQFAVHFESARRGVSTTCLLKIVGWAAEQKAATVPCTKARELIESDVSDPDAVLTWLVNEALLIENVCDDRGLEQSVVLRPAFERLGDFLIATEVLATIPDGELDKAAQPQGALHSWLKDSTAIETNRGVLAEFAVLAAERIDDFELPDLAQDPDCYDELASIAIKALVFRDPKSLTHSTVRLIQHGLHTTGAFDAMDAVLSCAWRPSSIDAMWLHRLLKHTTMADRDAFWCGYLHNRFESGLVVKNLISAVDELSLGSIEPAIAERWATTLLWFTAAADRRVKDLATRAATSILTSAPPIIPDIVKRFIDINDDEVRDRVLLSCYGAMLLSRNADSVHKTASYLYRMYMRTPTDFDNAVIRDHMRCICELSVKLSPDASGDIVPEEITNNPASTTSPLELPSDEDIEKWEKSLRFRPDEFRSDFFKYSMNCLRPWKHGLSKLEAGKWIAQRVALDFAFFGSKCEGYDGYMLQKYGGGRAKPAWAERIAKKYAWIALSQLASRLHDHVERRIESCHVGAVKDPLILPEGRNFDPTIPKSNQEVETTCAVHNWTFPKPDDLKAYVADDFREWLEQRSIPTLDAIVRPQVFGDRHWRPITAFLDWYGIEKGTGSGLYRLMRVNVQGYLVPTDKVQQAYENLRDHNLFGSDLPGPSSFLYGFPAEYPWSAAFVFSDRSEQKELPMFAAGDPPVLVVPAWSEVLSEWEYDVSRSDVITHTPARQLLGNDLWWDGRGGFSTPTGKTVFVGISFRRTGPRAVLADTDFLNERLLATGLSIVLTMVGEKIVLAPGPDAQPDLPRPSFSQVGFLDGKTERFSKPIFVVE